MFFADDAHSQAEAELRGKRALKGEPDMVESTSPRYGRRPATTLQFAWRQSNWYGWDWRATATLRPR